MFNYSMQLKVYSILASFLIFLKDFDNAAANPMFGENVRLANPGEFPFVASVKRINPSNPLSEYDHLCTGVLISNRDVLTVEHCLQPLSAFYIEISVGSHNIREGIKYPIDWWMSYSTWTTFRHIAPRYNKNDISIIRLLQNVTATIQPVVLSNVPDTQLFTSIVTVAGFGKTATGAISNMMETVDVTILSRNACEQRLQVFFQRNCRISVNNLCAAADPVALMSKGNSGSPVLYNGQLIGIHKATTPSNLAQYSPGKVNLFVSVDYYREYITDVLQNHT